MPRGSAGTTEAHAEVMRAPVTVAVRIEIVSRAACRTFLINLPVTVVVETVTDLFCPGVDSVMSVIAIVAKRGRVLTGWRAQAPAVSGHSMTVIVRVAVVGRTTSGAVLINLSITVVSRPSQISGASVHAVESSPSS